jgi:hypothetical protein
MCSPLKTFPHVFSVLMDATKNENVKHFIGSIVLFSF